MNLDKESLLRTVYAVIGAIIGLYVGAGLIIFSYLSEEFQYQQSPILFLITKIAGFRPAIFESIAILIGFAFVGIFAAWYVSAIRMAHKARAQLKEALDNNKIKDEFTSMLLHHIRTPLAGIKWSVGDLLKDPSLASDHHNILEKVSVAGERSLQAVDHLVAASQASLDRVSYNLGVYKISEILEAISGQVTVLSAAANSKQIHIVSKFHTPSNAMIKVDKEKIMIVFETLLENAINYTNAHGVVTITTEENTDNLFIKVTDTGIGISPEDQKKMFSQFFRSEETKRMRPSGFGIGLYLAQNFMKYHRGHISFVSHLGKGTTFAIRIPKMETPTEDILEKI